MKRLKPIQKEAQRLSRDIMGRVCVKLCLCASLQVQDGGQRSDYAASTVGPLCREPTNELEKRKKYSKRKTLTN